jgi:hypothetical protein
MEVIWFDRLLAAAWWVCAIIAGPISVVGFFMGGWLVLGALAAVWMNMDVKNPFARSSSRQPEQVPPS